MTTLPPSNDLQVSHLPLFPGWGVLVDAIDYAIRRQLAELDLRGVAAWYSAEDIQVNAIGAMLEFVGIGGLDTAVLGEQYRRDIYQNNATLRRLRGTDAVLEEFSDHTGIDFEVTEIEDANNRVVNADILVVPPLGRTPGANWQNYMRHAFEWMLPADVPLRTLTSGVLLEDTAYAYSHIEVTREVFI